MSDGRCSEPGNEYQTILNDLFIKYPNNELF